MRKDFKEWNLLSIMQYEDGFTKKNDLIIVLKKYLKSLQWMINLWMRITIANQLNCD